MGFDVNFNSKPIIKEAQAMHDGGAGNLGYFEHGEKEEKSKKEDNSSIFNSQESDSFKKSGIDESDETFSFSKFIAEIIFNVKSWFKNIFGIK